MRFLVAAPKVTTQSSRSYYFPAGLAYVSASLKRAGFDVVCLNLNHERHWRKAVRRACREHAVDVFCTGGLSADYRHIKAMLQVARAARPGLVTVVGGGLVSSEPEAVMKGLRADIGVVGEGEVTMVEIARALTSGAPVGAIPGTVTPNPSGPSGTYRCAPARAPMASPDEAPLPDYEGFGYDEYLERMLPSDMFFTTLFDVPRYASIVGSRSCPYQCSFCYHPLGGKYRQRSLDSLFAEIDHLVERYGVTCIVLMDELFATRSNRPRVKDFCDRMKRRGLPFFLGLRVDVVDEELMALLSDAGCVYIGYGIESAHDGVLKSMNKHITVAQIERALELTRTYRIGIQGNIIFGDSGESARTARHSLDWWRRNIRYQLGLSQIYTYPGSPLYKKAIANGLIPDRLAYIEEGRFVVNGTTMDQEEYDQIIHEMNECTRFEYEVPGTALRAAYAATNAHGQDLYEVQARCPHCGGESRYRNLHHVPTVPTADLRLKLVCRACRQRYDLPPLMPLFAQAVIKNARPGRLGIYGAGGRTLALLERLPELRQKVGVIYDSDPAKDGTTLAGIPVRVYPGRIGPVAAEVDAIGICSTYHKVIFKKISSLRNHGIHVATLNEDLELTWGPQQ